MTHNGTALLDIRGLQVAVDGKPIVKGLDLTIRPGEVHALMGRNGSGKSSLSHSIMGHPRYQAGGGSILFQGADLAPQSVEERARKGIFLAFQYPSAIPGVSVANFLRAALRAVTGKSLPVKEFRQRVREAMEKLEIDPSFATRAVNDGFSGGEKKRLEMLQMSLLEPKLAILDETDSGLDIDALRTVSLAINALRSPERGILVITHYQRILRYVPPDFVHVMIDGRLVRSGGPELAHELEERGYDWLEEGTTLKEAREG